MYACMYVYIYIIYIYMYVCSCHSSGKSAMVSRGHGRHQILDQGSPGQRLNAIEPSDIQQKHLQACIMSLHWYILVMNIHEVIKNHPYFLGEVPNSTHTHARICTEFAHQKPQPSHLVRLPGRVAVLGSLGPSGGAAKKRGIHMANHMAWWNTSKD